MGAFDELLAGLARGVPDGASLHCPARLLLLAPTASTDPSLDALLAAERVARVWSAAHEVSERAAEGLAGRLGVDVVVREGLGGDAEAVRAALEEIADTHRGEAVAVVTRPQDLGPRSTVVAVEAGDGGWWVRTGRAARG